MKKTFSNGQILGILTSMNDNSGKEMLKKNIPIKMAYALHRSIPEIEKAYKAYSDTLNDLCEKYGAKLPENGGGIPKAKSQKQQKEMDAAVIELLNTKVEVDVHTISENILEDYDDSHYDPLSFADIDRLSWLFNNKEDKVDG